MIDLTGQKFGKLLVIRRDGSAPNGGSKAPMWLTRCDCGQEKRMNGSNLRRGVSKSCGCTLKKHGMFGTPEYRIWDSMVRRCHNPKHQAFKDYGGRGITVCASWRKFENFFQDMGRAPPGMWLDRINNNGNYEPGNCRWATPTQQGRNKRTNRLLTVGDVTATVPEWAERSGLKRTTIKERLRRGWSPLRAVTAPPMQ